MPNHPSPTDFLVAARSTVAEVSDMLRTASGDVSATRKADGSLVTEADKAADAAIAQSLAKQFSGHAVLSEEGNTVYDPGVDYTWVIDPLDGTTNFTRGLPLWGISVALLQRGDPLVGMLAFPMLEKEYTAVRHAGARCNDQPISADVAADVDDRRFIMCCTRTPRRYQLTTPLKSRILGSAAYHIAAVADGSALAGIEATPKLWDVAAALLVLVEAGGVYRMLQQDGPLFPLPSEPRDFRTYALPVLTAGNRTVLDTVHNQLHPLE